MKFFIALIVLAALGAGGYFFWKSRANTAGPSTAAAIQTEKVGRRTLMKTVSANGKVVSNQDIDIKCRASGEIIELPFDVNDKVPPNALLVSLDTKEQERAVASAKAQVTSDRARLNEANVNWEIAKKKLDTTRLRVAASIASARARFADAKNKAGRVAELFKSELASKEELETAQTAVLQADAQLQTELAAEAELEQQKMEVDAYQFQIAQIQQTVNQNQDKLENAEQYLTYCTVRAPTGENPGDPPKWVVQSVTPNVRKGYLVQSGTSGNSGGTTVMVLSDLSHIFINANVAENEVTGIAPGQYVGITTDAIPNVVFDGAVVRRGKETTTSNVTTYEVRIEVTSPNREELLTGLTTTSTITVASRENALVIPMGAFSPQRENRNQNLTPPTTASGAATASASAGESEGRMINVSLAAQDAQGGAGRRGGGRRGGSGGRGPQGEGRGPGSTGPAPGGEQSPAAARDRLAGTVQVMVPNSTTPETRNVVVGMNDGEFYEVLSGDLQEDDLVVVNKVAGESRWRGGQGGQGRGGGNPGNIMRGIGGGGGGGGRGR